MKLARTFTRPGAKGGSKAGGNQVHGSIAKGRGPSPAVITPATQNRRR